MNKEEKLSALLTVAQAYLDRYGAIQYDQRAMDRKIQLTQRRAKMLPPEAATEEYTLFLDCSSYVFTLFRETFGYELPSDLTWHMIDLVKPRVFLYEKTGAETDDEKAEIIKKIRATLEPGDIITYDRHSGSGHTMLYIGDEKYTHCTPNGRPNSYDYENKKSREYETGLFIDTLEKLFGGRLFAEKSNVRRISISRPLEVVGEPTESTLKRIGDAKGLYLAVTSSHSLGNTAKAGDIVEYTLTVRSKEEKEITVLFEAAEKTELCGSASAEFQIGAGEERRINFSVKVSDGAMKNPILPAPRVTVNGLNVFVHGTPLGEHLLNCELSEINKHAKEEISDLSSPLRVLSEAYGKTGLTVYDSESTYIRKLFAMFDSTSGDVLYRKAQNPKSDGAVYSLFGGTGVTTPENVSDPFVRCTKTKRADLAPGDIIIICDDPYGLVTYSCYYTGDSLIGKFEANGSTSTITGDAIDKFADSLLGRFSFVVIRPALLK